MSAAFLSSASSTIRRASSSGGRSAAGVGAFARCGRPSARARCAVSAGIEWRVRSRFGVPPCGLGYSAMVADVGRDRIRDEVAQGSPGRRSARSSLADRRSRGPIEECRAMRQGRAGVPRGTRVRRPDSRRAARPRRRASSRTRRGSRQVIRPRNASADRIRTRSGRPAGRSRRHVPRACPPCTTARRGRARAGRPRTARCRRSPARPSPAAARRA